MNPRPDTLVKWLRRRLITGFFVMVPLVVSVIALVWAVQFIDGLTRGLTERVLGRYVPGVGIVLTAAMVLLTGIVATNVLGRRLLRQTEALLLHVPFFRTIYGPLKQLIEAFSPDNEAGFKRVVLVEQAPNRFALGFLTREFVADRGRGPETFLAVYVPSNQLYLGQVVIAARENVSYPDLTVEQAVRTFLTGGMALPPSLAAPRDPPQPPLRDEIMR